MDLATIGVGLLLISVLAGNVGPLDILGAPFRAVGNMLGNLVGGFMAGFSQMLMSSLMTKPGLLIAGCALAYFMGPSALAGVAASGISNMVTQVANSRPLQLGLGVLGVAGVYGLYNHFFGDNQQPPRDLEADQRREMRVRAAERRLANREADISQQDLAALSIAVQQNPALAAGFSGQFQQRLEQEALRQAGVAVGGR